MNLSNTGGGGRGSDRGDIIGRVINHGKKVFWARGLHIHYHHSLKAGENTLEAQLARLLIRRISSDGKFISEKFLKDYVIFMTTSGTHNDTYASTCHRMFFANYDMGVAAESCADNDNHNVDAIDSLTLTIPVIIATVTEEGPSDAVRLAARKVVALTRKSKFLPIWVDVFADMLANVVSGKKTLKEAVVIAANIIGYNIFESASNL
jgi:hypothetical protein